MMLPPGALTADESRLGIILRKELVAEGCDDRAIARRVRSGELAKVRRGAYTDGERWKALDRSGRYALQGRAVLRQARTEIVLSHTSGLPEYGAPLWGLDLADVHVTRLDGRAGRKEAGVAQHRGVVLPDDVVTRNRVPVMSGSRLILEVATVAGLEPSLCVANYLLHEGFATEDGVLRRLPDAAHWPNSLGTEVLVRLMDPRIESVGETRTLCVCYLHGLPMPEPQVEIKDRNGRVFARVDFAWPELGVFLEFDGMVKYQRLLREHESPSDVVVREKRREEQICLLTGWRCIRVTWEDLRSPARLAARIYEVLFPATAA